MCPDMTMLSAYFDDELTDGRRFTVLRHLEVCAACRATLSMFEEQRRLLRTGSTRTDSLPADLERFWKYAAVSRVGRFREIRRISVPLPLAAAAVLALAIATMFNFFTLGRRSLPEVVVVDTRAQTPAVVSFTITPADLDNFLASLEGQIVSNDVNHVLPADLPVSRFGDPLIVRPPAFEGAP